MGIEDAQGICRGCGIPIKYTAARSPNAGAIWLMQELGGMLHVQARCKPQKRVPRQVSMRQPLLPLASKQEDPRKPTLPRKGMREGDQLGGRK